MLTMTEAQLSTIADEAYGTGISSDTATDRAYAAGVEDLARHLLGQGVGGPQLGKLLDAVRITQQVRGDIRDPRNH